jgi:hypothetical protein
MDSTGRQAAPTALYTNVVPSVAMPPPSTPSCPPSGGNGGNNGNQNKNNNKNRNEGNGSSNNGSGCGGSSGQATTPTGFDDRIGAPWPTYGHPW